MAKERRPIEGNGEAELSAPTWYCQSLLLLPDVHLPKEQAEKTFRLGL